MRRYCVRLSIACLSIAVGAAAGPLGCSEEVTPSGGTGDSTAADASGDSQAGDAAKSDGPADATADAAGSDASTADAAEEVDTTADDAGDSAATDVSDQDVDWSDLLDPQDTGSTDAVADTGGGTSTPVGQLYAESPDELYRLDLETKSFAKVGKFTFNKNPGEVTDIALDQAGALYAITNDDLFTCTVEGAKCTWLAALPSIFNGLTFVPKGTVSATEDTLIGISQDGAWTQITFAGSKVTLKKLGTYANGWLSSGDAFSVEGIGTYATLKGKGNSDSLASIDPKNGKILKVIGETGAKGLYGLAWWSGVFYAFSSDSNVYTLDIATGKASVIKGIQAPAGIKWWGAGVSTRANGTPK